jgi:FAD/FMN-containing dehydrogenase
MSLVSEFEAVLGPRARRSDLDWQLHDSESARLAVAIASRHRAPLAPGYPQPGRTGLRAPEGILTLWPEELMVRVGAGTSVAALDNQLARHGLELGLEVPDPKTTTIGACFADGRAGFAGPLGATLLHRCTAVSFVDGQARLLASGARVVKNVAGYDFGRLHHAAHGSLGLVLDLTLRLTTRPSRKATVWWPVEREDLPVRLPDLRRQWGSDAACEVLVDRVAAARFGLPGAGVLFRATGDVELLQTRIERSNAVDVSPRWPDLLGASRWDGIPLPASALSVEDAGEDWVADLANGILRSARGQAPVGAGPSRAVRAIKRVLDPHGIWPGLPGLGEV